MSEKFAFLLSTRFYGNVIISVGFWLQQPDAFTPAGIGKFLVVLGGLFVAVRTIDRVSEKLGAVDQPTETN